jgi:hypothetical protein
VLGWLEKLASVLHFAGAASIWQVLLALALRNSAMPRFGWPSARTFAPFVTFCGYPTADLSQKTSMALIQK